jgi:hypothetical protein
MNRGDYSGWTGGVVLVTLLLAPVVMLVVSFVGPEAGGTQRSRNAGAASRSLVFAAREYYDI